MGEVVGFGDVTTLDIPAERVLEAAKPCDRVLVLGVKGGAFYQATSTSDEGWIGLMLTLAAREHADRVAATMPTLTPDDL